MMTDKETLIGLTKQMGLAQSGDEITRLWHRDAVWFDLQFYRKSGLENCRAEFNRQFAKISNVRTESRKSMQLSMATSALSEASSAFDAMT